MYQNLKFCLEDQPGVDTRSVHFLTFPTPKTHYSNPTIERKVLRMKTIITLGRALREKNLCSFKKPLRECVVIHTDPTYLSDLESLSSYIVEELNVKHLVLTSDESKYGVKYALSPDHKTLGMQYKTLYPSIRTQLSTLSDIQINAFVVSGELTLEGIKTL